MAEKRSDNFMNFGPEWLQNLSQPQEPNFTSNSFTKSRPASSTKCQLAEYRYGREEMLALFDANTAAPDYLIKHEELYVANTQLPIALQTDMDDPKRYHQDSRGANSSNNSSRPQRDTNFRTDARVRPVVNTGHGGRVLPPYKHPAYYGGPNPQMGNSDYHQFRTVKTRGPSWWREDGHGPGQPWRSNDNSFQHRTSISARMSWRYKDDDFEDNERKPQVRRVRKVNADQEDPGDSPCLPEWAENDNMGNFSGSFDALGAYTESNNDNNANEHNKEDDGDSDSSDENEPLFVTKSSEETSKKESFPANPVDKLAKKMEEAHIGKEPSRDIVSPVANKSSDVKLDNRSKVEDKMPKITQSAQLDMKESGQEVSQPNERVTETFNAPTESDESSHHNGCKGMAENINSLLNWVLEENSPDMSASAVQANYSTDQNVSGDPLYPNMDKDAMAQSRSRNVPERGFLLSAIERRLNDPLRPAHRDIFHNELRDISKVLPMGTHRTPSFQQVTPTMPINPTMMPLSYQQPLSAAELPWTPDETILGDMSLWNEQRMEMIKQLTLQRQQELMQMNMAQGLMMTPQISQEPTPIVPDLNQLNYQNYLDAQPVSYWDEVLRSPPRKQPTSYDVYNNYDFLRNNMQNRSDQITIEDVFRNSCLNMQMQNPMNFEVLNPMDSSLQANNMNNIGRSDLLQLLQQQQQQMQQVYVPPPPADINLLNQQYSLDTPLNFLSIPPPPLPQPIPMPERRVQMPAVSGNAPVTNQANIVASPELVQPKVETVEETNLKMDASNFEIVKKKEKKAKKKTDPEADSGKKKNVASNPAPKAASTGRQLMHDHFVQEQLMQRQLRSEQNNKPKVTRPAPWLNQPVPETGTSVQPQMSLTQIQRLEKEQQRKAQSIQKALSEQTVQKDKESVPWVHFTPPVDDQLSLLDIQNEERKQLFQQAFIPPDTTKFPSERVDAKVSKIGGIWGPPETNSSVWNFGTPSTSSLPNAVPQKPQQPVETSKKSNQNPHPVEDDFVPGNFNSEDPDELNTWAKVFLKNYEHKLDVEAFLSFIKNIESPYEVKEYIKFYLGETKDTMDFCEEYIDKRLEINRRRNQVIPADDLSAPAAAINPAINAENQESKGKNKKNKKKMSKIDSRILGFNVTAAADRFNIGDIDCIEKP